MKAHILPLLAILVSFQIRPAFSAPADHPILIDRGPHQQVWARVEPAVDAAGRPGFRTNSTYVELATGLNYLKDGQWIESREQIEPCPGGAIARQGQHQVTFANNLATAGAIDLRTPDGKRLRSHIVGLSYRDAADGRTVILAEVKDSVGLIAGKNQVIYADAFAGLKADVRYTYTKGAFEQDVILHEQPPAPEKFGMNPQTTRLQVMTEFLSPPEPALVQSPGGVTDSLVFGDMRIGHGRAFSTGHDDPKRSVAVTKDWVKQDGRQFLVESAPVADLKSQLDALPRFKPTTVPVASVVSDHLVFPQPQLARASTAQMKFAQYQMAAQGLVLDYIILNGSAGNYTFTNGTTYLITGAFTVSGTATIQGGTIIKYTNSEGPVAALFVYQVNCQTSPYRPAIFTTMDDNSVGDVIDGSTGSPSSGWNTYGLYVQGSSVNITLSNLRFTYLGTAIWFTPEYGSTLTLLDSQICFCGLGAGFTGTTPANFIAGNDLFYGLGGAAYSVRIVNAVLDYVTADNIGTLVDSELIQYGSLKMSNSILANIGAVANSGLPVDAGNNGFFNTTVVGTGFTTGTTPFQPVATAGHYLIPAGAFSGLGFVSTNSTVAASVRQKTTIVPQLLSSPITANTTLTARSLANQGALDLGYHYDVLDYLAATTTVQSATVTMNGGVAVGVWGTKGLVLATGAVVDSEGTPTLPNRLDNCRAVMEVTNIASVAPDSSGASTIPSSFGTLPVAPSATFRFTRFETPAGAYTHMQGGGPGTYVYTDCQFSGGVFHNGYGPGNGPGVAINVTNSLFEQVAVIMTGRLPAATRFYNCLFKNGSLNFSPQFVNTVHLYYNFIDRATITQGPKALDANYNGYVTGQPRLTPNGGGDQLVGAPDYQSGPLGSFYYPTSGGNLSLLINAGNVSAVSMGLSNYTTQTNQILDTGNVDIGFHYVGMGNTGSSGVDFWFAISDIGAPNINMFEPIIIAVSSKTPTSGTVAVPGVGVIKTFNTTAGTAFPVTLPNNTTVFSHNIIENLGIHVTAQQPVSVDVVAVSDFGASSGFAAHPVPMTGTNYCLVSRVGGYNLGHPEYSLFAITAIADNTTVTIAPSPTAGLAGHPGTNAFTVKLHQGQTYQPAPDSNFSTNDVTGTVVLSDKPVAIVGCDAGSQVPIAYGQLQPLMQQQLPVGAWGGWALGFPWGGRGSSNVYRVVAAYDNTTVTLNRQQVATLQHGQFFEAMLTGPVEVYGSRPIQVAHISTGTSFDNTTGDPTQTLLPSPAQFVSNCVFYSPEFYANDVTLIVPQSAISSTFLDGQLASSLGTYVAIGSSGYSGVQIPLNSGSHAVTSSQPVGVEVYGWGDADAYSYIAGRTTPLLAAAPDFTNVAANATTLVNVLPNDTYSNFTTVTVSITANGTHGTATVNGSKQVSYNTSGYVGQDQFTYQLAENGLVSSAVVTVWVGNHPPVASNDFQCSVGPSPVTINVLANDNDPDGNPMTVMFAGPASHGTVTINANQTITYDDQGASGVHDSFPYTITDSKGGSSTATVYINPVVAVDDSLFATQYGTTPLDPLANDSDVAGRPLTITAVTQGAHGHVTINPGSTNLTYSPSSSAYTGPDTFTYTVSDGMCSATATVNMSIVDLGTSLVSVSLQGPPDVYKGYSNFGIPYGGQTWFVISRTAPTFSSIFVTLFVGGDGTSQTSSDPCYAVYTQDFTPSGGTIAPFPNGYSVVIPAGQASVTVYIQTTDNPDDCEDVQSLIVTVPDNGPGSGFSPDPNAFQANAYIHHNNQ